MSNASDVRVVGLQADRLETPLGLESPPRLSWRLESERRGVRQSAYRVLVGSEQASLGDLWDSGRIESDRSLDIAYAGPPLASRQRCWWAVEVWDDTGAVARAVPSWWEMGLTAPGDWAGGWIAAETAEEREDREAGLHWIWGEPGLVLEPRRFRHRFELQASATEAAIFVGARDRLLQVRLDGEPVALPEVDRNAFGRPGLFKLDLGPLAAGPHVIAAETRLSRGGGRAVTGQGAFAALVKLRSADGRVLRIATGRDWRTSLDAADDWAAPGFDDSGWEAARPSEIDPGAPWTPTGGILLRRGFEAGKPVALARLYATALGAYEAFLNGQRVGDALLAPESTDFRKTALYQAYDVTALVRPGANAIGAHVGDGWYASVVAPGGRYAFGPAPRRLLTQLELTYADGSREIIATGPGWRSAPSPVVTSEIYDGEVYDARLEQAGWSEPGFDASDWDEAGAAETPPCMLKPQTSPPVRATQTLKPRSVHEQRPGVFVFDYGQNFAGFCRLRVKGAAGQRVELRFAEILKEDGAVDQANLRAARARDIYVLRGDPAGETYEPHFTYHGFRYVEVEGFPGAPGLDDIEGVVVHSDLPIAGDLRIDNPLIEQLWRNAVWSQRSNFVGVPTDCPQRDERLGWTGDACVFWDAAAFNMDVYAFTDRFAGDMRDAQAATGAFPEYAPAALKFGDEPAPGWADAGVVLPWTAWRRSGETAIIERNWDAIVRYLAGIEAANPDGLWANKRGLDFGDWLALDAKQPGDPTTPKDLVGTAWWAHSVALAAEMARATGRDAGAADLDRQHAKITAAFRAAYVRPDGSVGNESQTGYILALAFGLMPEALRAAAVDRLTADIARRGGVLSTGFLGTPFSLDVLADAGRTSLVYDLLLRTEFPSWGYMIAKGATTIWERWNGDTGDVAMNSFNHYALGGVCGFLFRRIAGIDPMMPGFARFRVRPLLDSRVKRGGASFRSPMGLISSDWEQTEGGFRLDLTVPPNAVAEVHLPAEPGQMVREGIVALSDAGRTGAAAIVEVGAGRYTFSVS